MHKRHRQCMFNYAQTSVLHSPKQREKLIFIRRSFVQRKTIQFTCECMYAFTFMSGLNGRNVTTSKSIYIPPISRSAYVYVCMYVCMHVCVYVCMYVHVCIYVHVCMYPHINTKPNTVFTHLQSQLLRNTHARTHAHTHTHTHMYENVHTPAV